MADAREALLRTQLDKICKERGYHHYQLDVKALPPTGANFTSQLFHVTISAPNKDDLRVFAKVSVVGETLRKQAPTQIFEIEAHAYTKLAQIYEKLQDDSRIPDEHRLVMPKLYGCSDNYLEEVIVLQDLSAEGYTTYDRLKSIDWEYASKSVEELAKLHALSFAYQEKYPEDFQEATTKILKREMVEEGNPIAGMIQQLVGRVLEMVSEEHRAKLQVYLATKFSLEKLKKFYMPVKRPVIAHGDYRMSNLMHKVDEKGNLKVMIVDYQTLSASNAPHDLLYFIFTGSDEEFRRRHYHQLVNHYYQHLSDALTRLNLQPEAIYPRADFDYELKEVMEFGLIIASIMLPMITVELAHVPASGQNDSLESMADMLRHTNALCAERLNGVVGDYVRWGIL